MPRPHLFFFSAASPAYAGARTHKFARAPPAHHGLVRAGLNWFLDAWLVGTFGSVLDLTWSPACSFVDGCGVWVTEQAKNERPLFSISIALQN